MLKNVRRCFCAAALLILTLLAVFPAQACGCGIYIPREGDTSVPQERALIRWDGQTQDIVMSLSVRGDASDAAWILPVPSRATVRLADAGIFDELEELTRAQVKTEWRIGGGGATGGAPEGAAVTVLDRQTIGPFDVSNLAASDAGALRDWLTANQYRFPENLDRALQQYVEYGWTYVAIKLTPAQGDTAIGGELDPLWVTFASPEIVYPMRASSLAEQSISVFLYVLADHRVTTAQSFGHSSVLYADWLAPDDLAAESALRPLVERRWFLTKTTDFIDNPARIDDDYHFTFADDDTPYHTVRVQYQELPGIAVLAGLAVCLAVVLTAIGAAVLLLARRMRRPGTVAPDR